MPAKKPDDQREGDHHRGHGMPAASEYRDGQKRSNREERHRSRTTRKLYVDPADRPRGKEQKCEARGNRQHRGAGLRRDRVVLQANRNPALECLERDGDPRQRQDVEQDAAREHAIGRRAWKTNPPRQCDAVSDMLVAPFSAMKASKPMNTSARCGISSSVASATTATSTTPSPRRFPPRQERYKRHQSHGMVPPANATRRQRCSQS